MHENEAAPLSRLAVRLGLEFDPFQESPETIYEGAERAEILAQLKELVAATQSVLLVLGDCGSGKTTLLNTFLDQVAVNTSHCVIAAEHNQSARQVLAMVARSFAVEPPVAVSAERLMRILNLNERKDPVLILIDDAHLLADDALKALMVLQQAANGKLVLLLFAEETLEQRLNDLAPPKLIFHRMPLLPLTDAEIGDYVEHYLAAAGHEGGCPLLPSQLLDLAAKTQGLPGLVNLHAAEALLESTPDASGASLRELANMPKMHLIAIGLLVAVLTVLYFSGGEEESEESSRRSEPIALNFQQPPANVQSDVVKPDVPDVKVAAPIENSVKTPVKQPQPEVVTAAPPIAEPVVKSIDESSAKQSTQPAVEKTELKPAEKPVAVAPAPKPEPKVAPASVQSKARALSADERKLLSLDGGHFTLQLLGSSDEKKVVEFIRRYKTSVSIAYFQTSLKGNPWFVAVTGDYASKDQARNAIVRLPAALAKSKPWIRNLADIHQAIKKQNP